MFDVYFMILTYFKSASPSLTFSRIAEVGPQLKESDKKPTILIIVGFICIS
jgi:hypothetical protein